MNLSKNEISVSLRKFVSRRDDLLHEDVAGFDHYLQRFLEFCNQDELVLSILDPIRKSEKVDIEKWWKELGEKKEITLPSEDNAELITRYEILESIKNNTHGVLNLGIALGKFKKSEAIELFRSLVVRPLVDELSHRLGEAADMASPEDRAL